jgi:hypothetical protein
VTVAIKEKHAPRAPRIPSFLFQKPKNKSAPNNRSDTPGSKWPPNAKYRIHPENERVVADVRNQCLGLVLKPFLITKNKNMITIDARIKW